MDKDLSIIMALAFQNQLSNQASRIKNLFLMKEMFLADKVCVLLFFIGEHNLGQPCYIPSCLRCPTGSRTHIYHLSLIIETRNLLEDPYHTC